MRGEFFRWHELVCEDSLSRFYFENNRPIGAFLTKACTSIFLYVYVSLFVALQYAYSRKNKTLFSFHGFNDNRMANKINVRKILRHKHPYTNNKNYNNNHESVCVCDGGGKSKRKTMYKNQLYKWFEHLKNNGTTAHWMHKCAIRTHTHLLTRTCVCTSEYGLPTRQYGAVQCSRLPPLPHYRKFISSPNHCSHSLFVCCNRKTASK